MINITKNANKLTYDANNIFEVIFMLLQTANKRNYSIQQPPQTPIFGQIFCPGLRKFGHTNTINFNDDNGTNENDILSK